MCTLTGYPHLVRFIFLGIILSACNDLSAPLNNTALPISTQQDPTAIPTSTITPLFTKTPLQPTSETLSPTANPIEGELTSITISYIEDHYAIVSWDKQGNKLDELWSFPIDSVLQNIKLSPQGDYIAATSCTLQEGVNENILHQTACEIWGRVIPRCPNSSWIHIGPDNEKNISHCDLSLIPINAGEVIPFPIKLSDPYIDWAPDGTKLAFATKHIDESWDLYLADINQLSASRVTNSAIQESFPVFSPDGTRIMFYTPGNKVFSIDLEDGAQKNIGEGWWNEYLWLHDNNIIMSSQTDYYYDLFLVYYDSNKRANLSRISDRGLKYDDRDPVLSPTGDHVLYRSYYFNDGFRYPPLPNGNYFYLVPANSFEEKTFLGVGYKARWSFDGKWIFIHGWPIASQHMDSPPSFFAVKIDTTEYVLLSENAYSLIYGELLPGYKLDVGTDIVPYEPINTLISLRPKFIEGVMVFDNPFNYWYVPYEDPIDLEKGFRVTINFAGFNAKTDAILLTGRPYDPNLEWWENIIRMQVEQIDNDSILLFFLDGRAEDSSQSLIIDNVFSDKPFTILFDDPQGKSFSVVNHFGNTVASIDVGSLNSVSLPNGLFPDSILYPGVLVEPGSILRIKEFHIAMQYE